MLSNAYLVAKLRFDTAENEPAKILQNSVKFQQILAFPAFLAGAATVAVVAYEAPLR